MSNSVWDEGDGGSQEKQLDRVSQEDILSPVVLPNASSLMVHSEQSIY